MEESKKEKEIEMSFDLSDILSIKSLDFNDSIIQNEDITTKESDLSFQIPKFSVTKNEMKKRKKKKQSKEYIKDKNKESAKRYRQRHKYIYVNLMKENEKLKNKLSFIMNILENNLCLHCMNLVKFPKQKEFFIIHKNKN
jgi:hypothetical protein